MWFGFWWFWWWLAFIILFFFLPLGYGWGYRGWGPWYRYDRRRPTPEGRPLPSDYVSEVDRGARGAAAVLLWLVFIIAIVWFIAAIAWV